MHSTAVTRDTKEAAAFLTLDIETTIISDIDQRSSERIVRFLLARSNESGEYRTKRIQKAYREGALDPQHPYHTIRLTYRNHGSLLDCARTGRRLRLVPFLNSSTTFELVDGDTGLSGVSGTAYVTTNCSHKAAALVTCGFEPLRIEEASGSAWRFSFPAVAHGRLAADLLERWNQDNATIPWSDPFAQAMRGQRCRADLTAEVKRAIDNILIHKPGTRKYATIRGDATGKAWAIVQRHLS